VYNLPEPPAGHSYRAWLVGGDEALSLGPMELNDQGDGRMTGAVSEPLDRYEALQLTVEPTGAEDMSGPIYLEASL
jgi:anti-sigma-K factor RskA